MSVVIDGTTGVSGADGSAATPALRGEDANTGIFFPAADTIAFSEGGVERLRIADAGQIGIGGANYGTSGQVLTSGGPSATPSWATPSSITLGTAVSASGTFLDFTGIPSWARRVTVMFNGISTNSVSPIQVQLGDSGGVETTGYAAGASQSNSTAGITQVTTGFPIVLTTSAVNLVYGALTISTFGSNAWVSNGVFYSTIGVNYTTAGTKTLSATLDRVRITTANGTDTFDAGTVNVSWEG